MKHAVQKQKTKLLKKKMKKNDLVNMLGQNYPKKVILNKNKIDNLILEEIKKYIIHPITYPVPKEKCSINCDCSCPLFECTRVCCSCFTMWFGVLFLLGFLAVIAWCFITKK